jgi:hypothetical protein
VRMLTVMSNLALVAHATPPPTFNSNFFVTAATVIPVLFLAINVQPIFQYMWTNSQHKQGTSPFNRGQYLVLYSAIVTIDICLAIGIAGEVQAIRALANQGAPRWAQTFTEVIVVVLTCAAAIGPLLQLIIRQQEILTIHSGDTDKQQTGQNGPSSGSPGYTSGR